MSEQLANFAWTTIAGGGYTAGSGLLNVGSTAAGSGIQPFPGLANFSIAILDQTTKIEKTLLQVTAINSSTQFATTNNGTTPDVNCNAGDIVQIVMDTRAFVAYLTGVTWTALTYSNSWTDFGGGYQTGQYGKDAIGRVWLRGLIKGGTLTPHTVIATLPVGFRPTATMFYDVDDSNVAIFQVNVNTNGTITWEVGSAASTGSFVGINGISFLTN